MIKTNAARTSSANPPNRRKTARRMVDTYATLETMAGKRIDGVLTDLSTHGCAVRADLAGIGIGRFVSITAKGGQPVQGIVRWIRDDVAGLEFLQPIPADWALYHKLIDRAFGA